VIDLAARTLGFAPRVPIREGLTKTIAYFERVGRTRRIARSARMLIATPTESTTQLQTSIEAHTNGTTR
jgi:hypothetical protein